jgi:hypothetical protein
LFLWKISSISHFEQFLSDWAWWFMSIIPALGKWRQKDYEVKASLALNTARTCLKKTKEGWRHGSCSRAVRSQY